ncbi:MAG: tRNA lysidine(34) synthetase TilS [Mycoplasmoidaceae bacterium]
MSIKSLLNKKIMIAVSGGPDSMCLLDLYKKKVAVACHVNYHKRDSSNRDQIIVEEYCKNNNIKLEILNVNDNKNQEGNFQANARKIRYDFFEKIGNLYNLNTIYTGHNFNDFLETAWMQKKRSDKLLFYGIKKKSHWNNLKIDRPLIMMQRKWIENYCKRNQIKYGLDETNDLPIYERNSVRMKINYLTPDEQFKFKQKIIRHNSKNKKLLDKIKKIYHQFKNDAFDIKIFIKYNELFQHHLIYLFLTDNDINPTSDKINAIIQFIKIKSNKQYRLKKSLFLTIKNNCLVIQG